ncbi:hypothetical protein [Spartinivicinus ruber]|uniref:hypothetical protein n=1 Tax=Spartinivicinus ruber TaxID=2683272 RepID=UPI0013D1D133|nr:hypothetical protein [Spartinivicinus ruber]
MKVIYSQPYSYLVVEKDSSWYLTFFTGGPVEIDICVKLNDQEITESNNNKESVKTLIEKFKKSPDTYQGRRVIPLVYPKNKIQK